MFVGAAREPPKEAAVEKARGLEAHLAKMSNVKTWPRLTAK